MSYISFDMNIKRHERLYPFEFHACEECGALVVDTDVHDKFHSGFDYVASDARQAVDRSYDYDPPGRYYS